MQEVPNRIFELHTEEIYADPKSECQVSQLTEGIERGLLGGKTPLIDKNFLSLLVLKRTFSSRLHIACAKTMTAYFEALSANEADLLKEYLFFINHHPDKGLLASAMLSKRSYPGSVEQSTALVMNGELGSSGEDNTTLCFIHTHPGLGENNGIVRPSVALQVGENELYGDLVGVRVLDDYGVRPLFLIMQQNIEPEHEVRMLFFRESLQSLSDGRIAYNKRLLASGSTIKNSSSQEAVIAALTDLGFNCALINRQISDFYSRAILGPSHVDELAEKLI